MEVTPLEYNVAGPADDEDFAQAEYLAEMLMVALPSIKCTLYPIMPDDWTAFVSEKAGFLGCKQRAPLVWMSSGAVVGGLPEFAAEVDKKYGLRITGIDYDTWTKVAKENHAAAIKAEKNLPEPRIGGPGAGPGAARGEAVAEELVIGNARYLEGADASSSTNALGPLAEPAAAVLCLTPLPQPAHVLLGCAESAVYVVPCTPAGIEELAVGNAEHAAIALKAKALLLLASPTAELATYVSAAKAAAAGMDMPLAPSKAAALHQMLPALSR